MSKQRKIEAGDRGQTRREMLWHGAAGAAALCSLTQFTSASSTTQQTSTLLSPAEVAEKFAPFEVDLPIPDVLDLRQSTQAEITMEESTQQILHPTGGDDLETRIWAYNGQFPGPTILARQGNPVEITHHNELPDDTEASVHLHGGHQEEESDGALHEYHIGNGGQHTYEYPGEQPGATLWYHDHAHGFVGPHLNYGLLGFHLLTSPEEEQLGVPVGDPDYDVPLAITDRSFLEDGSFHYPLGLIDGFFGDTILVNGAIAPRMAVKRRIYRLRFLNASNAREYTLRLGNGRPLHQIAGDTALLDRAYSRNRIHLAPGERADVLVDFSDFRPGSELILHNTYQAEPNTRAVMRFDVEGGGGAEQYRIPGRLRWREPIPGVHITRELTLEQTGGAWTINGLEFDEERLDMLPWLHTVEEWRFLNHSNHPHPMHVHDAHFRIVSINGQQPHPADRGWKDTVNVPPSSGDVPGTVVVRPYFNNHAGRFVTHCHTAEHSDRSMMSAFRIREP